MDRVFTHIATRIANASGQPITFVFALVLILIWAATGPVFHYSDTWQLIVNTATTVVTFLMVFLIQNSQNRDASAMQAKLDELIRAVDNAREQFIGIEHLTDLEICQIRDALEEEVRDSQDKQKTADDTVDRLLRRHYRIRRMQARKANAR
ncbi:low affinity iron permease family protein [Sphingomonas tabacisoli]|uniref:Low affinity iron permease family protein n=1 Tax=Sphingomonas tabacisoli TaxID=2249466 RepID=A0ABW4HYE3_9SPHN